MMMPVWSAVGMILTAMLGSFGLVWLTIFLWNLHDKVQENDALRTVVRSLEEDNLDLCNKIDNLRGEIALLEVGRPYR